MSILIAGFGDLGRHIASELRRNPSLLPGNIYALSRHVDQSKLPEGIQAFAADLTVPETLTSLPTDITHVVYCVSADASNEQAYQSAYVQGLHNLLDCFA